MLLSSATTLVISNNPHHNYNKATLVKLVRTWHDTVHGTWFLTELQPQTFKSQLYIPK